MKKTVVYILILFIFGCSVIRDSCFSQYEKFNLIKNNDMLFIRLTFNGKKVLFLLDTGASKSVIDINKASKYGFGCHKHKEGTYTGIGGMVDFYSVFDYNIVEAYVPLVGIEMDELSPIFKNAGVDIIGIIGSDFLNQRNSFIDYENQILYYKGN